jgi:hypothetical protein
MIWHKQVQPLFSSLSGMWWQSEHGSIQRADRMSHSGLSVLLACVCPMAHGRQNMPSPSASFWQPGVMHWCVVMRSVPPSPLLGGCVCAVVGGVE